MKNLNKHKLRLRDQIFNLLSTPLTATDIKEKLPHIKSMGTIAYHLNNMAKEGFIVRDKQEHVRGQPTYFYWAMLKREGVKNWYELQQIQLKKKEKLQLNILREVVNKKNIDPYELDEYMGEKEENNEDDVYDFIFNNNNEYLKLSVEITDKGREALKLNRIKQGDGREAPHFGYA
jgi:predicted transcriptional regulator